jgi:hypothetical protein
VTAKPTVAELGVDPAAVTWRGSGTGDGAIEVAFTGDWVLMRVAGDPDDRVLVFDRHEWECFLDGARNGEFDPAAAPTPNQTAAAAPTPRTAAAAPAAAAPAPSPVTAIQEACL